MSNSKIFPVIYKRTKTGKVQELQLFVERDYYYTVEGFTDGKKTTSAPTVCKPKNVGRSNATTAEEQAVSEADSKFKRYIEQGYTEDISKVDEAKSELIGAMLAHGYKDNIEFLKDKELLYSQPKLDGIRCLVKDKETLHSRGNKQFHSVPHISEQIYRLSTIVRDTYGDEFLVDDFLPFDGELYNHKLKNDFNKITSLVKKKKPTERDLKDSKELVEYHIYDIRLPGLSFSERINLLTYLFTELVHPADFQNLRLVSTVKLGDEFLDRDSHMDTLYQEYIQDGYEGQMIRNGKSSYQPDRTKDLLKRKEFQDEEFKIIGISEGTGARAGMMGRIHCETKKGVKFDANSRGTVVYFTELLVNSKNYIGKTATIRFQNYTPDGVPRFPVCVNIAREDYE